MTPQQWLESRALGLGESSALVTLEDALVALEWQRLEQDCYALETFLGKNAAFKEREQLAALKQKHGIKE